MISQTAHIEVLTFVALVGAMSLLYPQNDHREPSSEGRVPGLWCVEGCGGLGAGFQW